MEQITAEAQDAPGSLPLIVRWAGAERLPVRHLRPKHRHALLPSVQAPPWLDTGPSVTAFDFCGHVRRLARDIVERSEALGHIDIGRVLFGVTQARNRRHHGLQARITPLRFAQGQLRRRRRDTIYQVQRYFHGDREFLYLLTFCLPRFLDQDFADKLVTLFHELYHIDPEFNGDLRRHQGRYAIHSHSQKHYDRHMADLARAYLAGKPDPRLHAFLRLNSAQLQERHGAIAGTVVPRPKIIPVGWASRQLSQRASGVPAESATRGTGA